MSALEIFNDSALYKCSLNNNNNNNNNKMLYCIENSSEICVSHLNGSCVS